MAGSRAAMHSHDRRCKNVRLARKSSPVLHEIFDTARQLRHELIGDFSERDLQTCMRVLTQDPQNEPKADDVQLKNGRRPKKKTMSVAELKMATREAVGNLEHRFGRKRVYIVGGIIALVVVDFCSSAHLH